MSVQHARIVFPFRALAFFSVYIVLNTILYHRDRIARDYVLNRVCPSRLSHPNLPSGIANRMSVVPTTFPEYASIEGAIYDWAVAGDFFIVLLFIAMILGLLSTQAHISFFIAMLHFIAVILVTHMVLVNASRAFLICAVVFGILLPIVIEIWNLLSLIVFKSDFYFSSQ
jgi:hypothetical protein